MTMETRQKKAMPEQERSEVLSKAKLRLLQQRIQGISPGMAPRHDPVRPRLGGATVPLSAEQRLVWLHASQHLDLPIYNEPFTIHRRGTLDLGVLEAAMNEILRRHEAWRTSFSPEGEQIIHQDLRVTLPSFDFSHLPRKEREVEALRIATEAGQKPISLHKPPLFRACVVRMTDREHRLYVTMHHIIFDAVSISRIFLPELVAIYNSFEQGHTSPLPDPTLQYGDYAIWRERQLESPAVEQHLAYWRDHLSGELPVLRLPEDRPHNGIAGDCGSMECFEIPIELVEDLRRLTREEGVTLYMALLAGFKLLLFRYSGQNDLIVGSAMDGRRRSELETVMGYFVATFAIRTRLAPDMRFSEFLAQTRDAVLAGLEAADIPFDRIVREINPQRDPSHHPIFQAFFSARPPVAPFSDGWNLTQMDVTTGATKFVLHLEFCERPEQLEARFFYSTEIWDASTIRRMSAHWLVLLKSVCQNPETTLGALAILTPEETAAVLLPGGWNDTACAFPQESLDVLIEQQVRRTPQAIAAICGQESWTYERLSARAEVLAALLRSAGVTRGSIVAVAMNRSLDLLAGTVAILKTGAAYLPLDIWAPEQRLALCLADARPSAILTERSMMDRIAFSKSAIVLIDEHREFQDPAAMDGSATRPAQNRNDLENTAYLIYTSGTSGEPKPVEVSHRSLVNLLAAMREAPGFGPEDVLLAVTPVSFDIAALELFLPVISGGVVVIASREEAHDPYMLARAIRRSSCTVMQATPATWRTLLMSGWDDARRPAKGNSSTRLRILCGGEALPGQLASSLLATGAELWNMYGPTETTIWSLIHRVDRTTEKEAISLSVGRPIANTTAYILDEQFQLVPVGVPGELFLGGLGLAKGYRSRPRQTADRFVEIDSVGGDLLYRTGDVALRRSDGTIQVLGRTDNQVKVRGYRVELEAVEAAVLQHRHVAAAAARAWPESVGNFRLSVYVVAAPNVPPPNLAEMRAFLGTSLPDSMIPSDVIAMPAIPLTPHGKIDRARLPAPTVHEATSMATTELSSGEASIAGIWADLLGRKNVGLDEDFFSLGGHSLLVAVLQQRLAAEFGQRIPIVELFHRPTVREQGALTRRLSDGNPELPAGVVTLNPNGTRSRMFWVHSLGGPLAAAIGLDQPFVVVSLAAEDLVALGDAPTLQSIGRCLVGKVLAIQSRGPFTIGGLCAFGILAYEMASQLQSAGYEVSRLILLDAPNPSYLESIASRRSKFNHLVYLLRRSRRLGLRRSLVYLRERSLRRLPRPAGQANPAKTEMMAAQEAIEVAARAYHPEKYEGNVLLLLASERAPHLTFLPGWQAVITGDLHAQYVRGHHRDLLKVHNIQSVADAIVFHLKSTNVEESQSCHLAMPGSRDSCSADQVLPALGYTPR